MSSGLQPTGPEIDLPVEMMLQFFSYLDRGDDSDLETLIACSKVSRKWNTVVLPLLFSELGITFIYQDNESQGDKFANNTHGGISYRHLALVFTSLQHTSRILPHVRKLHLRQRWVFATEQHTAVMEANFVDSDILGNVIRLFPRLTHVQFTYVRLRNPPEIIPGTRLQDLEEVLLELPWGHGGYYLSTRARFIDRLWMLNLCGSIKHLDLNYVDERPQLTAEEHHDILNALSNSNFSVEAVTFSDTASAHLYLIAFQSSPLVLRNLKSLDFRQSCDAPLFKELANLYRKLPDGLAHLACDLNALEEPDIEDSNTILIVFTLPGFLHIQSLELYWLVWLYRDNGQCIDSSVRATSQALEALGKLGLRKLRCIKVNILGPRLYLGGGRIIPPPHMLECFRTMHRSLLRLPALQTFVINNLHQGVAAREISPRLRSFYQNMFPDLHSGGRLSIIPA